MEGELDYERIIADIHRNYAQKIEILEALLNQYRKIFEKTIEDAQEPNEELQAYHGVS